MKTISATKARNKIYKLIDETAEENKIVVDYKNKVLKCYTDGKDFKKVK